MPKILPSQISVAVQNVLKASRQKEPQLHPFLTAYQILDRLEAPLRDKILTERGRAGKKSGNSYSAANLVSQAARMLDDVEIETLDVSDLQLPCANEQILAGNPNVALYRQKR
jgi:hypothetical protein